MDGQEADHLEEGDGRKRKERPLQAEAEVSNAQADGGRKDCTDRHAEPWRQAEMLEEQRRSVTADAVIGGMAERQLAGIAAQDVPGSRERAEHADGDEHVHYERGAGDGRDGEKQRKRRQRAINPRLRQARHEFRPFEF